MINLTSSIHSPCCQLSQEQIMPILLIYNAHIFLQINYLVKAPIIATKSATSTVPVVLATDGAPENLTL